MFESLKKKIGKFKKSVDEIIRTQEKEEEKITTKETTPKKTLSKKPVKDIKAKDKIKSIIVNQEVIINEKSIEKPLWELEMALLESDVAMDVAEEIINTIQTDLIGTKRKVRKKSENIVEEALEDALLKVVSVNPLDFDKVINAAEKPVHIAFIGVNGTGKTTTIAKIADRLKKQNHSVVIAAADTFRAGAIDQIEHHAKKLGIKIIKHQQGADPAAVAYDSVEYAKARHIDVVLTDTAGRMHTNTNLMDQLKKICRITPPNLIIFVDEAIAGNDAVERATLFNKTVPFDGSILTKIDADAKGGAAISIAHATSKPILFLGTGQEYTDLEKFNPDWLIKRLLTT
ncbi:signal recognition particle-docking protein FtsY [Methanosarcinales archaeon ex4572_44]|nr:MAG: signal recognition particle-docking protein FtsY [Methanosarcinales archaeon ex4484_138]PHP45247.1 MAG: signal recognition particle-docking protein FtsY [Methanosarcinales archaeon ex4572_44]